MLTAGTTMKALEASRSSATRATARAHAARSNDVRATAAIADAIVRVEAEYREMPGLSVTLPQAARLWGLDRSTCERVLTTLIERRILRRALNGTYVRR